MANEKGSIRQKGTDTPSLVYLNRYVRESVAVKWHDVGIELLKQEGEEALRIIKANNAGNVSECCAEMLQLWLRRQPNATWNQLICALRSPGIQLNDVAMKLESRLLPSAEEASSPKAVNKEPQPSVVAVQFSPNQRINDAFIKLSAGIKMMIKNCNLDALQGACVETVSSPNAFMPIEIIPKIEATETFHGLYTMLAKTPCWNFLDTRLLEAMATASMIPAAQESVENYKKTFFSMKLSEVKPYIPILRLKRDYTEIEEVLDKDPREFTIWELHKHRFYLETELFKIGSGTLRYYRIMLGSVIIVWQIHVDDVYQAYSSLKDSQLPSHIVHLRIPQTLHWVGIPIIWRGQNMEKIGPIKPELCPTRYHPYDLPKEYEWVILNSGNLNEIYESNIESLVSEDYVFKLLQWMELYPNFKKEFSFGVRISSNKQLIDAFCLLPMHIAVNGKVFPVMHVNNKFIKEGISPIVNLMNKEVMRVTNLNKIHYVMMYTGDSSIIKHAVSVSHWFSKLSDLDLPLSRSPKTVGLRRIMAKDIPSALTLTNKYASQFEIGQVFQTEEEFSHYFFCLSVSNYIITYVVEDSITGNITDMFSFRLINSKDKRTTIASVTAIVVTKTPARQFITDMLVCAQKEGCTAVITSQYGLSKKYFNLFRQQLEMSKICLINYNYPEADEENCCLFAIDI